MDSVVTEAEDRETHLIRGSLEDYLSIRRYTGGVESVFDLLLLPFEIPDDVLQDQRIVDLEIMANAMIAVANVSRRFNDIYASSMCLLTHASGPGYSLLSCGAGSR